jgi:hypothetical protein
MSESVAMSSLTADSIVRAEDPASAADEDFSFLPGALVDRCRPFIKRYHELNGYSCLPDILWQPEVRIFIDCSPRLRDLFKASSSSRSAKKANEGLAFVATVILSTEILASGFAGWGARYPAARRQAQFMIAKHMQSARAPLIERYLYPQIDKSRSVLGAFAPTDPA